MSFHNGFVGNNFVGVAGDDDIVDVGYRDTSPTVVDLTIDQELKSQISKEPAVSSREE
jgi:hypothetical protein